ncbi:MAG: NDP-sugar synthase [bacterium]
MKKRNVALQDLTPVMVLAAGRGTRLQPLTYQIPKPMLPIVNRPVLEHSILNLKNQGFSHFLCNLHSHAGQIRRYFGDGKKIGVNISYSVEQELLGNAGGVKKAENFFKGNTFAVISGDGFTNIDLNEVIRFHKKKHSFATMVLKKADIVLPFGITELGKSGRIKKFVEKPSISDFVNSNVNTGIYVFEPGVLNLIPRGQFYDFGTDLWPKLLGKGYPIYGFVTEAYWCDVGNLSAYRQTQMDVLSGKVKISIPGKMVKKSIWLGENVKIGRDVKLNPPCLIGKNCSIAARSRIGPFVTIGKDSIIGRNVSVKNSIIWDNAVIDKSVKINNCIIGYKAKVKENISIYEGTVINIREEK